MGGRGSGGKRSGGGGASSNPPKLVNLHEYYNELYSKMTDLELNRAYVNARVQLRKEQAKVEFEYKKFSKMVDEFKAMSDDDPKADEKWYAIEKQSSKLNEARSKADIRSTAFYLAVNEKYNIRAKYNPNDMKNMTNGQLNSFYNNSYRESNKARKRIETTSNAKTRAKYQKIYDMHNNNFKKASAEMQKRGLDGKGW